MVPTYLNNHIKSAKALIIFNSIFKNFPWWCRLYWFRQRIPQYPFHVHKVIFTELGFGFNDIYIHWFWGSQLSGWVICCKQFIRGRCTYTCIWECKDTLSSCRPIWARSFDLQCQRDDRIIGQGLGMLTLVAWCTASFILELVLKIDA